MKFKMFNKKDAYITSKEAIRENKRVQDICDYYGIRIGHFSDQEIMTKDELIALNHIVRKKAVPQDICKRLLETKKDRIQPIVEIDEPEITEEEAFAMFGISLD